MRLSAGAANRLLGTRLLRIEPAGTSTCKCSACYDALVLARGLGVEHSRLLTTSGVMVQMIVTGRMILCLAKKVDV